MLDALPFYLPVFFALVTLITVSHFFIASNNSRRVLVVLFIWLALQSFLSLNGFYLQTMSMPPRVFLLVGPPLLMILVLFVTKGGRAFLDQLDLKQLTWLHTIRVPVEIVLLLLSLEKAVPELMTFEGRNFDVLSGISAPIIALLAFRNGTNRKLLLVWNCICLGLLLNIVINAVLALPVPFQQFAFDQPNRAVLYFPFVWLPCCVVPIVLLSHLAAIRQLLVKSKNQ